MSLPASVPRWLPNLVTVVRLALIPAFIGLARQCQGAALAGQPEFHWRLAALGALLVMGASDVVDGFLARRYGLATQGGAVLDAVADKLAQVVGLLFFALARGPAFAAIPWWYIALLFGRDLVVLSGGIVLRVTRGGVRWEHRWHGKASSALIFGILVAITMGVPASVLLWALGASTMLVTLSTLDYVRFGWQQFAGTEEAGEVR